MRGPRTHALPLRNRARHLASAAQRVGRGSHASGPPSRCRRDRMKLRDALRDNFQTRSWVSTTPVAVVAGNGKQA
jgi:hypothetical protein